MKALFRESDGSVVTNWLDRYHVATINAAPRRFVADSPGLQRFIERYRTQGAAAPRFVDRTSEPARPSTVRVS
jgi:hypothetical protein